MFKNVIAPVQAWLLASGKCVGCGMPLANAKVSQFKQGQEKVSCKCGRIFIRDIASKKYRRALFEEV